MICHSQRNTFQLFVLVASRFEGFRSGNSKSFVDLGVDKAAGVSSILEITGEFRNSELPLFSSRADPIQPEA